MKKQKTAVRLRTEFDVWLDTMCARHMEAASRGQWDGTRITEYYTECRRQHIQQGIQTVLTRDVGYCESGRFKSQALNRCFNLSVAAFSPVNLMPEAHRQDVAIQIVRRMFWPMANQVWVEPPKGSRDTASDIWHYLLFCERSAWTPMARLPEEAREELQSCGLISFRELAQQVQSAQ